MNWLALDRAIFDACNGRWHLPPLDLLFTTLTAPPHKLLWIALLALLFLWKAGRRRWVALAVLALTVLASDQISSGWLKPWIDRERPCFALPEARLLLSKQPHSPSFPSGHATNSAAVAVVLFRYVPALRWLGLAAAILLAYSRVYVGVHYPSDVLCGALIGTLVGFLVVTVARSVERRWSRRRGSTPVDPLASGEGAGPAAPGKHSKQAD